MADRTDAKHRIARDLMAYLQEQDNACAEGSVHGRQWIRYHNGEWQGVNYGGAHRLKEYVQGDILSEEAVLDWMTSNPVQIIPLSEAYLWKPKDETVWEDANTQDVFEDCSRCYYCGNSERTTTLKLYKTVGQGQCWFCSDCHASWDQADEIESGPVEPPA